MKRFVIAFFIVMCGIAKAMPQKVFNPQVTRQNNKYAIQSVEITSTETIVKIFVSGLVGDEMVSVPAGPNPSYAKLVPAPDPEVSISSATVLFPSDEWNIGEYRTVNMSYTHSHVDIPLIYGDLFKNIDEERERLRTEGRLIKGLGKDYLDVFYTIPKKKGKVFELHFEKIPANCSSIDIRELQPGGNEWIGIKLK